MFEALGNALDAKPAFARRNRFAPLTIAVRSGDDQWAVTLGREPIAVSRSAAPGADIALAAAPEAWRAFAQPRSEERRVGKEC